jgi:membrane-bound metal-dependent hydrolase YbcI (DUF457 family)
MQGPSHLLLSWYYAEASGLSTPRDRRIVAWSGFAPDVDVLAYAGALAYFRLDKDLAFEHVWQVVHHRYTHGLAFVLLTGIVAWLAATRSPERARVALLALLASALHNFFDLVAGGPTWPIYPLWPFSDFGWYASWSWTIGEWPNLVILFACLAGMFAYARAAARSPLECFGDRADAWFVRIVRQQARDGAEAKPGSLRWVIWAAVALVLIAVLAPLGFNLG